MENPTPSNQLKLTVLCGKTLHSFLRPNPKGNIFYSSVMNILVGGTKCGGQTIQKPTTYGKNSNSPHTKKKIALRLTENKWMLPNS